MYVSAYITWRLPLLILLIVLNTVTSAASLQESFPTMQALEEAQVPAADRYDLARRFQRVQDVPSPLTIPVSWKPGDVQPFFVNATESAEMQQIQAELLAIGEHVLVWGDQSLALSAQDAQAFAARFDVEVYQAVTDFWGIVPLPGVDADPRVVVLFTDQVQRGIAGYFSAQNTYPQAIIPASNEHEMIILHHEAVGSMTSDYALSVSAHELQHLLRHQQDNNEFIWVDEGFSGLTQYELGFDNLVGWSRPFALNPQTQLNAWGTGVNRSAEYGAGFLFSLYFYERYGIEGLHLLSQQEADGLAGVNATLATLDGSSADEFFADWVLANFLQDDPQYGYESSLTLPQSNPWNVEALPYQFQAEQRPYSTYYYQLPTSTARSTISLDLPDSFPMIPSAAASGDWMWYSLRGDDSNPRLTRAFDLREVESASLEYSIWYDLEEGWDYGYVSISADGGETWEVQQTPQMSNDDPNRRAYAAGYTGESLFWREESLSLDAYTGREILVRFEVVTDDAINQPGMALDDLRIEATGYASDLETDGGGWQAEGWIRTDNRLAPRAWVQAVQLVNGEAVVTRWLAEGDSRFTLENIPGAETIYLAISPLAPLSTEMILYTLRVE
ncbi:MAG: immune inhibitor A [Anaerolineae bacterium]|nr:immune inhibitor A [Anaerolineae bacterium]